MRSMKSNGATRRVWRMTAENQLGEILELPDGSNAGRNLQRSPLSRATSSANLSTWRASSYDLLQGLTVRDVSDKIRQPTFEALFSADAASCKRGERS